MQGAECKVSHSEKPAQEQDAMPGSISDRCDRSRASDRLPPKPPAGPPHLTAPQISEPAAMLEVTHLFPYGEEIERSASSASLRSKNNTLLAPGQSKGLSVAFPGPPITTTVSAGSAVFKILSPCLPAEVIHIMWYRGILQLETES